MCEKGQRGCTLPLFMLYSAQLKTLVFAGQKFEIRSMKSKKINCNTLALLKNRHTERIGHPIGDRLKLRQ